MRSFVRRLGDFVAAHAVKVVVAVVLFTITMAALASQARPLNQSSEAYAPASEEFDASIALRDRFGEDDTLPLQVLVTTRETLEDEGSPILTADGIRTALVVEEVLRAELGDVLVPSPAGPEVLSFATPVIRAAEQLGLDPAELDDARVRQLYAGAMAQLPPQQGEFLRALVAGGSPDGSTGIVLATLDAGAYVGAEDQVMSRADDQRAFVEALEQRELPVDAIPFSFVLLQADDGTFMQEVARLFGIAILVVLLVLAGVLHARRGDRLGVAGALRRTAADVALGIGVVLIANVWVRGFQVALGPDGLGFVGAPTPPTNIVSILLIALGVDYAIHFQARYRDEVARRGDPAQAVRAASRTVGTAILLGALTTAVGFLTNLTSPLGAIRDLGLLAAVGLVSAFVLTTTFLPAVRGLLDARALRRGRLVRAEVAPTESQWLPRLSLLLGNPALRNPWAVVVAGAVIAGGAVGAATQLETEFDLATFLPDGSDSQRAFVIVNDDFAGGFGETTEVLLTGDVTDTAVHNAQVEALARLTASDTVVLNAGRLVGEAPPLALQAAMAAAAAPDAPAPIVGAVDAAVAAGLRPDGTVDGDVAEVYAAIAPTGLLDAVLDLDPGPGQEPAARWSISTQSTRTGIEVVVDDFGAALADLEPLGVDAVATSTLIVNLTAIDALSSSQVRGLAIALAAVLGLLTVVYGRRLGRWEFGALLMIPVAAVAICTLGLMALTGIPFDPVTAMVSALVIGVGIDFTIHLGERFVEDLDEADGDPERALRASIQHTGSALAGSALTTVLGFAVLTTGSLVPFQRLGSTTIYAVGLSLFAVVALQPAILLLWARSRPGVITQLGSHRLPS